ncbi:MAG: VOC family protein, partial [Notoacmeibacter sp.]
KGNCTEALNYYQQTIGATVSGVMLNKDTPDAESRMPGPDNLVMNAVLHIGESTIMASDSPDDWYEKPQGFNVYLEADSAADATRIFTAFANGGAVTMPLGNTFWAELFGMVTDKFGTPWMVSFTGNAMQG